MSRRVHIIFFGYRGNMCTYNARSQPLTTLYDYNNVRKRHVYVHVNVPRESPLVVGRTFPSRTLERVRLTHTCAPTHTRTRSYIWFSTRFALVPMCFLL